MLQRIKNRLNHQNIGYSKSAANEVQNSCCTMAYPNPINQPATSIKGAARREYPLTTPLTLNAPLLPRIEAIALRLLSEGYIT